MQSSNPRQTISKPEKPTNVSPFEQSGSPKNDASQNLIKRFAMSDIDGLRAAEVREAFAFDGLCEFELYDNSEQYAYMLKIEIGEVEQHHTVTAQFSVYLVALETNHKARVLSGQYHTMGQFKATLKAFCRALNMKPNRELVALAKNEIA